MVSSGYELSRLIDLDRVQRLCDSLSQAFDVTLAVLDLSGNVLIATGWQDICTGFHREHPETLRGCLESDLRINQRLVRGMDASEHYAYRCSNGLWDVAFPLVVGGEHLANVYTGQFFFDDDDVDREAFAERARSLEFDVGTYLEALDRVPVITQARLQKTIGFLSDFVGMLGELGLVGLQHEQKHALLLESEQRYRSLFDNAAEGLTVFRVERNAGGEVQDSDHRRPQPHAGQEDHGLPRRAARAALQRMRYGRRAAARLLRYRDGSCRRRPAGAMRGVPEAARGLRAALGLSGGGRPVGGLGDRHHRPARGRAGAASAGGEHPARLRRRPRRSHRRQAHPPRGRAGLR